MDNDIIIIGGGPAGLTAGIHTSRGRFNTLLLEKEICGGLPATTELIENYPGFPEGVSGMELMKKFKEQAERFGLKVSEFQEVTKIERSGKIIKVRTEKEEYSAPAAIVASGSVPKRLNVPGEEAFRGRGVSYCATCDGPLYRDKDVAVIGCGNAGLQEGEFLLKHVKSITFVAFRPHMTAEKILQERLQRYGNAKFLLNHALTRIKGDTKVGSILVKNRQTGEEKEIKVGGVFIYVGYLPNSAFLKDTAKLDKEGYVIVNDKMETSAPGIYAAGDVCAKKVRQIDTASGDATVAALSAMDYIKEMA